MANIGESRIVVSKRYPIKVPLPIKYSINCSNNDLRQQKYFFVRKILTFPLDDPDFRGQIKFEAALAINNAPPLAFLLAREGGVCLYVVTYPWSLRCGLATELMKLCFDDEDVGGVDLSSTSFVNEHPTFNNMLRVMASYYCEHIVFVNCNPFEIPSEIAPPTPTDACYGFLNAAKLTSHLLLYSYPSCYGSFGGILPVITAMSEFKRSPERFVHKYGEYWFFCECKTERLPHCTNI